MKLSYRNLVRVFTGLAISYLGLVGGAGASPTVIPEKALANETPLSFYQDHFDVSKEVAEQRLWVQEFAFPLSKALPKALGGNFSSLEFVNSSGSFIVRVKSKERLGRIAEVFKQLKVPMQPQVEIVGFNESEVQNRVRTIARGLDSLLLSRKAQVGIESGHPVVWVARSLSIGRQDWIDQKVQDRFGTTVDVVKDTKLQAEPQACSSGFCDSIVAGSAYNGSDSWACTHGFVGTLNDTGRKAVLTAGHCLISGAPVVSYWFSQLPGTGVLKAVGHVIKSEQLVSPFGDVGLLRVDEVTTDWNVESRFINWGLGYTQPIIGAFTTTLPLGVTLCVHGTLHQIWGGSSCGILTATGATVPAKIKGVYVAGLLQIEGATTYEGYSGGPWVFQYGTANIAAATHVAGGSLSAAYAEPVHVGMASFGLSIP